MLTLEAFQSGLSWLTILRKRGNFRCAFDGWDVGRIAEYGDDDVERLLADAGIVRHRGKIEATIQNARAVRGLKEPLSELLWRFEPESPAAPAGALADLPSKTAASAALSKELARRGFRFVGPTTAYSLMQAVGIVDDHLAGCAFRGG
jgi:DNA-3-methyladenine glycosylase I